MIQYLTFPARHSPSSHPPWSESTDLLVAIASFRKAIIRGCVPQVFDDWTFAGDRGRLQASIGPVIISLLPDSSKTTRIPKLEDAGIRLILQILTNHATCHLILQILLADRMEASLGLKGTVCAVKHALVPTIRLCQSNTIGLTALPKQQNCLNSRFHGGTGIQQAFKVYEIACEDQPKLLIATCSDLVLHPDRNCSLDVRMEALQGDLVMPSA